MAGGRAADRGRPRRRRLGHARQRQGAPQDRDRQAAHGVPDRGRRLRRHGDGRQERCTYSSLYSVSVGGTRRRALTPPAVCHDNDGDPEYRSPSYGADGDLLFQVDRRSRCGDQYQVISTRYGLSWKLWSDDGSLPEPGYDASFRSTSFQPDYRPSSSSYLLVSDASFEGTTDGRARLYVQDARGGAHRQVGAKLDKSDPTSSPDGAYALYMLRTSDGGRWCASTSMRRARSRPSCTTPRSRTGSRCADGARGRSGGGAADRRVSVPLHA